MKVLHLTPCTLSPKAEELVQFDVDSVRQVVAGRHAPQPSIWLADPEQYEHDGRIHRDSTSPRLLAYSPDDQTLYANDGCNSCTHRLSTDLKTLNKDELRAFADANKLPPELVERIAELVATGS